MLPWEGPGKRGVWVVRWMMGLVALLAGMPLATARVCRLWWVQGMRACRRRHECARRWKLAVTWQLRRLEDGCWIYDTTYRDASTTLIFETRGWMDIPMT